MNRRKQLIVGGIVESAKSQQNGALETDYADEMVLLARAPAQTETLLHSLKRAAAGIGLYIRSSLKLVDKFTYIGSSDSSTETDINTRLVKA